MRALPSVLAKLLLVGLLLVAVRNGGGSSELVVTRAPFYPFAFGLVPSVWLLRGAGRGRYPALAELLLLAPFLLDAGFLASGLYEQAIWPDRVSHFANWLLATVAFAAWARRNTRIASSRGRLVGLCLGFGLLSAFAWELVELSFHAASRGGSALGTDTLIDMSCGSAGALCAAGLFALIGPAGWATRDPDTRLAPTIRMRA